MFNDINHALNNTNKELQAIKKLLENNNHLLQQLLQKN